MSNPPFTESHKYREANQNAEDTLNVRPAFLSDGRAGIALFIGNYQACITETAGIDLATMIADTISTRKGN